MKNKGITLIALIITVIVMLILAGLLTNFSLYLIEQVKWVLFKDEMSKLDEAVETEIENYVLDTNLNPGEEITLFEEKYSTSSLQELSESLRYEILYARDQLPEEKVPTAEFYNLEDLEVDEDEDGNADGMFYVDEETSGKDKAYIYDEQSKSAYKIKPTIIFGTELHSFSYGNLIIGNEGLLKQLKESQDRVEKIEENDNEVFVPLLTGEYKEKNGLYMCEPDFTGFNPTTTYYVTWDNNGNEIFGNVINKEPPENWYNYKEKKWANVVTMGNGKNAYWVWIPRYAYKIVEGQTVDVKFVNKDNQCTEDGFVTTYADETPIYDDNNIQTNYVVPDEFRWENNDGEDKTEMAGYWISKYKVSTATNQITKFNIEKTEHSITITSITASGVDTSSYEYYFNGEIFTGSLPYTFDNLKAGREYSVGVRAKTTGGIYTGMNMRRVTTLSLPKLVSKNPKSTPDLTGFNTATTYYVSWDENGNETLGHTIAEEAPTNWYNYPKKEWANVMSMANGKTAYWVWIPRYEYKIVDSAAQPDFVEGDTKFQQTYITFIDVSKTTPTEDYIIPDEFSWENTDGVKTPIKGYWLSKYKVSTTANNITKFNIEKTETSIKILSVTASGIDTNTYEFYFDGHMYSGSLPYTFNNLTPGKEYSIGVRAKTTGGVYTEINMRRVTTLNLPQTSLTNPNLPDLTGFDTATTYYVYWDNSGNEIRGNTIAGAAPSDWYNYPNKKWANVVSTANGKTAYWVWIPRYEYTIVDTATQPDYVEGDTKFQQVFLNFIDVSKTTPTPGYIIPDEFSWENTDNNKTPIRGYWISKYKVSN